MNMTKVNQVWDNVHAWCGVHPTVTKYVLFGIAMFLLGRCTA